MADYDLYYWPVPFRGQFVRAILAYAVKSWEEHDADEIVEMMAREPTSQPIPFMGPPLLIEKASGFALAQMPAITLYLGRTLDLLPADATAAALAIKIVNDTNDVIDEITLDGGQQMWTDERWDAFVPRLQRWMRFWEAIGARHGLTADAGHLLGGDAPGLADIATATLWTTMGDRFPKLAALLDATAPKTAALCRRISALPPLAALAEQSRTRYGDAWCGGEIEKSLRKAIDGWQR